MQLWIEASEEGDAITTTTKVQLPGIFLPGIGFGKRLTVSANNHGRVYASTTQVAQALEGRNQGEKVGPGGGEEGPPSGPPHANCNAMQIRRGHQTRHSGRCRSPPTSLALLNSIVFLRPAALHHGLAVAAKAVGVSLASSPNRTKLGSIFPRGRGQARSAPCQHYTPRACQCRPASLSGSFSFVAGWSTSMGSARWGETVEESFGPVWWGGPMRSNCTGLRSTLN